MTLRNSFHNKPTKLKLCIGCFLLYNHQTHSGAVNSHTQCRPLPCMAPPHASNIQNSFSAYQGNHSGQRNACLFFRKEATLGSWSSDWLLLEYSSSGENLACISSASSGISCEIRQINQTMTIVTTLIRKRAHRSAGTSLNHKCSYLWSC